MEKENGALSSRNGPGPLSVLFFLEGREVPATRFRVNAFARHMQSRGIVFKTLYTRPSKYLHYPRFIRRTPLVLFWAGACLAAVSMTRVFQIVVYSNRYDVIFLQRSMLHRINIPILEALLFRYIRRKRLAGKCAVVFDVDDAIYLGKSGEESFDSVSDYIARNSDLVICGNTHLFRHFSILSDSVVIPTCIDRHRYRQKDWSRLANPDHRVVIGWTGLASNIRYLKTLRGVFEGLEKRFDFRILVICEQGTPNPFPNSNLEVEMRPWSAETEIEDLSEIDIGIMPLSDDAWAKGKCGLKLIQYMAIGIPSVASCTGVNAEIVKPGETGYLVASESEWSKGLSSLLSDRSRMKEFGAAGRRVATANFTTDRWFDAFLDALIHQKMPAKIGAAAPVPRPE